jgi:hypothetical protein
MTVNTRRRLGEHLPRSRFSSRELALTSSLGALYTLFRVTPISKFIGLQGSLTANGMITPVIAVLVGPLYGIVAVFIGTIIASFAPWVGVRFPFPGVDAIPGILNALIIGLAVRGKRYFAALVLLGAIGAFTLTPSTRVFVGVNYGSPPLPYFWMHLVAFFVLVSPLSKDIPARLRSGDYSKMALAIGVLAFAGTMIEHIEGGMLFALFYPSTAAYCSNIYCSWRLFYLVYPVERVITVLGAVLVCPAVLRRLERSGDFQILRKSTL